MHAKILKLGSLFLAAALASLGSAAHADNINTSGTVCNNFNAGEAQDLDYIGTGVRIANTAARTVVCAIPRSPLQAGATPGFFIDGTNSGSNSTSCTMFTYAFDGTNIQSVSFSHTGTYDHFVTFPSLAPFDYADVVCTLPGSFGGVLFGVTSLQ